MYITSGQFKITLFMLIQYLIITYGKIYPIQMIELKHNTKSMQYDPQTPIDTVFNPVKYILGYGELAIYPYNNIHTTDISNRIINRTTKFQDKIKTWNQMSPFHQNWINFKTNFCTAHYKLEETSEQIMEDAGHH